MSHYSSAPRRGHVIIHHAGIDNSHTVEDGRFCRSGYDFTVSRQGRVFVCRNNADTFYRWQRTPPSGVAWHASGCDCQAIGICMHGCFGGCRTGNVLGVSREQRCSVAFLISHLRTPLSTERIRPHSNCSAWNPCNHRSPASTVCPGDLYTGRTTNWNATGRALRDRLILEAENWTLRGFCYRA
jgi:hypothetical protein